VKEVQLFHVKHNEKRVRGAKGSIAQRARQVGRWQVDGGRLRREHEQ
jgi:hypothetical protein